MRQFTTPEQTAKLIELGFEKPKMAAPALKWVDGEPTFEPQYTIGELIEMLPKTITREIWSGEYRGKEGVWGLQIQNYGTEYCCTVSYEREHYACLYLEARAELIDALYDMIIKLKKEGVI